MKYKIFQVYIELQYTDPKVWRRLLLRPETTLPELHQIIQAAFDWTGSHLHDFSYKKMHFSPDSEYNVLFNGKKYHEIEISHLFTTTKDILKYEYDFGDSWTHHIRREKYVPYYDVLKYPVCIGGAMNSPMEDMGGSFAFHDLLEYLKDPENYQSDFIEYFDYYLEERDPYEFNLKEINRRLRDIPLVLYKKGGKV